jgi:hypothetical protein
MLTIDRHSKPRIYNNLPAVEDADHEIHATGLIDRMTEVVGPIFISHGVSINWGIGLLHHHWPIFDGEIPAEDLAVCGGDTEWPMRPIKHKVGGKYVPCLLSALRGTGLGAPTYQALEFSSDPAAIDAIEILESKQDFLVELHDALLSNALEIFFGLTSTKRVQDSKKCFVEFTSPRRASILRQVHIASVDRMNVIQTSWIFSPDVEAMACKRSCFKMCTVNGHPHRSSHSALHDPNG